MEDFDQLFDDDLFEIDKVEDKTVKLKHGERRMVSILFADIKGFTALSEVLDHEEVQTLLDQLMKIFSHCVEMHGGYVDKYTGDQIMALFGAKKASEVDTQRAINTAFLMLEKLQKFNILLKQSKKYKNLNIEFSIRVGINTGMVTTGAVGKEREGDYTVYGDTVNLASRMESNAPINAIMIPEETMLLVEDYFIFKDNSTIKVKGKADPISVFLVESNKDLSNRKSSPFIGRENEISVLGNTYQKTIKDIANNNFDKINFIGVTAEAGIGKTRLVQEYLESDKNISFSLSHASNISSKPYYIFITLIKDIFNISEMDSLETTKSKFEKGIKTLISNNQEQEENLKSASPFIGFLIGLHYKDERLKDRNEIQNHLHLSIKTLIKAICYMPNKKGLPHIILLDDMHWIDKMSLDTFEHIINTLNTENTRNNDKFSQLLILATYRNEFSIPDILKNELDFNEIHLQPLKKEDSIKLIKHSTKGIEISHQTILDLIDKSKGNPFFIEEWICLLKEKHKFSESIDESRGIKNVYEIPKTINALILARIDNLEKTLKLLLQKATIIGEDFFVQILSQLEKKLGVDDNIDKPVHNLEDEDFIHHYMNQLDHYKFKHMLTRDVAYSTILISNKVILHKAVAEIIEDYFSDKLEIFYFDLAIHYDISENYDKALEYLYLAGNKHSELFDYTHAKQCFERIIAIIESQQKYKSNLEKDDDKNTIYTYYINSKVKLGEILLDTGQWDRAIDIYKKLLEYNIESTDINYQLYKNIGQYYNYKHDYDNSQTYLNKALNIAKKVSNTIYIATITGKLGHCESDIGNFDIALKSFNEELSLFKQTEDNIGVAMAEGDVGMVLLRKGDLEQALKHFKTKYTISKKNDSKRMILQALGNIATIYNIRGQYEQSLEIYKEVLMIAEDTYDLRAQAQTYNNKGIIFKNKGQFKEALSSYDQLLKIAIKIGDKHEESNSYDGMATVYHQGQKFEQSIGFHLKAIKIEKEINDRNGLASSFCNLSLTFFDMGKIDDAKTHLDKGLKLFKEIGNNRAIEIGNFEMSKFLHFEDDYISAIDILNSAIKYFEEIDDTIFLLRSLIQLGILQRLNKESGKSIKTLNQALGIAKKINHDIFIKMVTIELSICDIKKSQHLLEKYIEENNNLNTKAYINFNIYQYTDNKEAKASAKKDYETLYKQSKKFEYHYYLNKLK